MAPHRLAEERSIAYHALVGERLRVDESVVARGRARVEKWANEGSVHSCWVEGWRRWLNLPAAELSRVLFAEEAARHGLVVVPTLMARLRTTPVSDDLRPHVEQRLQHLAALR
jgi:hypothetical protein